MPTVHRAKLASAERVTSAQMETSQTLTARAAFRATMGLRVRAVAAVIVVRGHSRMQDARRAKGVIPARTAPVGVRARTVSRLGFIHQMASRVWCVLPAKVRTVIARDALTVRLVSLVLMVGARSVLPARRRTVIARVVSTVQQVELAWMGLAASAWMETSRTMSAQAVAPAAPARQASEGCVASPVLQARSKMLAVRHVEPVRPGTIAPRATAVCSALLQGFTRLTERSAKSALMDTSQIVTDPGARCVHLVAPA